MVRLQEVCVGYKATGMATGGWDRYFADHFTYQSQRQTEVWRSHCENGCVKRMDLINVSDVLNTFEDISKTF